MKKNKFEEVLNSVYLKLSIGIIILYYIYSKLVSSEWLWNRLVKNFISKLIFSKSNEIILYSIVIFFVVISLYKSIKYFYKPSTLSTFLVGWFILFYTSERIRLHSEFDFYPLEYFGIAIIDFIVGSLIILFLLKWTLFVIRKNKSINSGPRFLKDTLYQEKEGEIILKEDVFNREIFANKIASRLLNTKGDGSLSFGIEGPWGSGKTYMLQLIKKELDKNAIIIDYNPWKLFEDKNIVKSFFDTLSQELRIYNGDIVNNLNNYSSYLLNSVDLKIWNLTIKKHSIGSLYNKLDQCINKLPKSVVIFIDDLDRLDKEEILDIFKLIRNTASFNNVYFITAFDASYLNDTLFRNESSNVNHSIKTYDYIEKIFQVIFKLPKIDKVIIVDEFKKCILENSKLISNNYNDKLKIFIESYEAKISSCLNNYRDIIRFTNQFCFEFDIVESEIEFNDFLLFGLIKFKAPDLIEEVYSNSKTLTRSNMHDGFTFNKAALKVEYPDLYIKLLELLFSNSISPKSINNYRNFYKYFSLSIFNHDLSIQEFEERVFKSDEDILELNNTWLERNIPIPVIDYKYRIFIHIDNFKVNDKSYLFKILEKLITGYKYLIINKNKDDNDYDKMIQFSVKLFRTVHQFIDKSEFEETFIKGYLRSPIIAQDFYVFHYINHYKKSYPENYEWISKNAILKKMEDVYLNELINHPSLNYPTLITDFYCLENPSIFLKERTIEKIFEFADYKSDINRHIHANDKISKILNNLKMIYKSSIEILQAIFRLDELELNNHEWNRRFGSYLRLLFKKEIDPKTIIEILLPNFSLLRSKYKTLPELELFLSMEVLVPKEDKFFYKLIETLKESNLFKGPGK